MRTIHYRKGEAEIEYIQSQAIKMNHLRDLWKEVQDPLIGPLNYGSEARLIITTAQKEYIDIMRRI